MTRRTESALIDCGSYVAVDLTRGVHSKIAHDCVDRVVAKMREVGAFRAMFDGRGGGGYAVAGQHKRGDIVRLHDLILPCAPGFTVDHINFDTLDNRPENLRPADATQQLLHRRPFGASSRFVGVSFDHSRGRWFGAIGYRGRRVARRFGSERDAALFVDDWYERNLEDRDRPFWTPNRIWFPELLTEEKNLAA